MRYLTNSESTVMKRCARKWYLSHYRKLYSKSESVNESQTVGILAHDALAEMYNSRQDPVAQVVYLGETMIIEQEDMLKPGIGDGTRAQIEQNIDTISSAMEFARIIIEGYVQWLEQEGEDQHLELLGAETERSVVLPLQAIEVNEPVALLAKLDTRFLDHRSNARVFMDHKVVQNFVDKERMAHLDPQFRFYGLVEYLQLLADGADQDEAQHEWTDGGILNMLRKVKRTASATPPFYKRKEVRHNLTELRNFFVRISGEAANILQKEMMLDDGIDHHLVVPPNPTRDCTWDCAYMTLCAFMDDGSDAEGYITASFDVGNPLRRYESVPGLRSQ